MSGHDCGCEIETDPLEREVLDQHIVYCPLHAAAQEMLEALRLIVGPKDAPRPNTTPVVMMAARAAIAKAREVKA